MLTKLEHSKTNIQIRFKNTSCEDKIKIMDHLQFSKFFEQNLGSLFAYDFHREQLLIKMCRIQTDSQRTARKHKQHKHTCCKMIDDAAVESRNHRVASTPVFSQKRGKTQLRKDTRIIAFSFKRNFGSGLLLFVFCEGDCDGFYLNPHKTKDWNQRLQLKILE